MASVYLSLGSNIGDRKANIMNAIDQINTMDGVKVIKISSLYNTNPIGKTDQPDFMNCAVKIETNINPHTLLEYLLDIEKLMGRVRAERWGPRIIDIDILLYDNLNIDTNNLKIPHPLMTERAFVMVPLAEIEPKLIINNKSVIEISNILQKNCRINKTI